MNKYSQEFCEFSIFTSEMAILAYFQGFWGGESSLSTCIYMELCLDMFNLYIFVNLNLKFKKLYLKFLRTKEILQGKTPYF